MVKTLAARYIETLEREIAFLHGLVNQAQIDMAFYRGKVERLELAIMAHGTTAEQQSYAARTDTPPRPDIRERKFTETTQSLPWSEVKRRWNLMSAEAQEKAIANGWNVDETLKEETNAGK